MNIIMNVAQPTETDTKKEVDETVSDESQIEKTSNSSCLPLSKKLAEIIILIQNVRQRLEDLSIEQRTEVSQIQWTTLEEFKSSPKISLKPVKFWQKSLFARIYFIDKDLDDIYQNILKYSSILYQHLNQFNEKVQSVDTVMSTDQFENTSQLSINKDLSITKHSTQDSAIPVVDNSTHKTLNVSSSINAENEEMDPNNTGDIKIIQQSFTDLMRAKIDFDSQFLNFNAIISKNCFSQDFLYLYKICANSNVILGQSSLPMAKRKSIASNNKNLRRKRLGNDIKKIQKKQLRKSMRLNSVDDSSEVQVIRSLRRREP